MTLSFLEINPSVFERFPRDVVMTFIVLFCSAILYPHVSRWAGRHELFRLPKQQAPKAASDLSSKE